MSTQKEIVNTLMTLGYASDIIQRAFKVYIKNYGRKYQIEVLVEIISRLQKKDALKISQHKSPKNIQYPIKINVNVTCLTKGISLKKKETIVVNASYDDEETMRNVGDRIINVLNFKHDPMKFTMSTIEKNPFIKQTIRWGYLENEEQFVDEPITKYDKDAILKHGLNVQVNMKKFIHKITANNISCQYMIDNKTINPMGCLIYVKMKDQYEYTEDNLNHLNEFIHHKDEYMDKTECKFSDECKAYKRLEEGDNKLEDLCHIKLFKHPPRGRNIKLQNNINSLIINKNLQQNYPLYKPTDDDKKKKTLTHLIE
eukprot:460340_1